jgi:hypothetical protein
MPYDSSTAPLLNNTRLPSKLENSGKYRFHPGNTPDVRNGLGLIVNTGYPWVEWTWRAVGRDDFAALVTLVGASLYSRKLTSTTNAARLWDDTMTNLITYTNCVIDRPTYGEYAGAVFRDVRLLVTRLEL